MTGTALTVGATFENGVFLPDQPLRLAPRQRVTLVVQISEAEPWPENVAGLYQEIADEDRRLASEMLPAIRETWPASEEQK